VILGPIRESGAFLWAGIRAGLTEDDIATAQGYAERSAEALARYERDRQLRLPDPSTGRRTIKVGLETILISLENSGTDLAVCFVGCRLEELFHLPNAGF
jgi:hypothetical protein